MERITSFKRSLGAIISCGFARRQRTNPAATLRILSMHGTSVLMSGLGSLVLSSHEIYIVDQQFKRTLQNLLKLSVNSPASLVCFTAGSLPGTAILHQRQLSLFGMICRLPNDFLNQHAHQVLLSSSPASKSWFLQIRDLLLQYKLPHPLQLLENPPTKEAFRKLVKSKLFDYWEVKFRSESSVLPSLPYFHPEFLSLRAPHRLWTTAGRKPYEVAKARIQLLFLSSQYPCGKLTKNWSLTNPEGFCTFEDCLNSSQLESPEHILMNCPAYSTVRTKMISMCLNVKHPITKSLVTRILLTNSTEKIMQLLLDCSSMPNVVKSAQVYGDQIYNDLFYLSRNWCFSVHRERMKRLGLWNFR